MVTGLVRRYGYKDTVEKYIDVAVKHFGLFMTENKVCY